MKRKITCRNGANYIEFGNTYDPFVLISAEGIYTYDFNVNTKSNSMTDGATYVGSTASQRNIVLTVGSKENHGANRTKLYEVFKPRQLCEFIYEEEDGDFSEKRFINYYVEKIENDGAGNHRLTTISLICPDPYFSDAYDTDMAMTSWISNFSFPHVFKAEPFANKKKEKLLVISNYSSVENIGMVITITAEGTARNPKVYHVESDSYIQVGTESKPFEMAYGDTLIISTLKDDKNAYLIRDGIKTSVNEYIDESSTYIQLMPDSNTIRYYADGEDNLLVSVKFRQKYLGV